MPMKPLGTLILHNNAVSGNYQSEYKSKLDDNALFIGKDGAQKRFDFIREYLVMRAYNEEKIKGANLIYLYNELNDKNSSLYKVAQGLASILPGGERSQEAESKFIKETIFASAKDGYSHISSTAADEYIRNKKPTSENLSFLNNNKKTNSISLDPPLVSIYTKQDLKPYTNQKAIKFHQKFDQLNKDLTDDLRNIVADNEERVNKIKTRINQKHPNATEAEKEAMFKQMDDRSREYKAFAEAAKACLDLKKDKTLTMQQIEENLNQLEIASHNYEVSHNKLTKAFFSKGRNRYGCAKRIKELCETNISAMREMAFAAYIDETGQLPDEFPKQTLVQVGKNEYTRRTMVKLNKNYDLAFKKEVLASYNLGKQVKRTNNKTFVKLSDQDLKALQAKTLAKAAVLEQSAQSIKSGFKQEIEQSNVNAFAQYKKANIFPSGNDLDTRAEQLMNEPKFQQMAEKATQSKESFEKYLKIARSGGLTAAMETNHLTVKEIAEAMQK